jgi:signal transduction histidine kinase/ligand-binding sensor domain-containing protein
VKSYLFHLLSFLVITTAGNAQLARKKYAFTHYGATQGVASNEIACSIQDKDGYIWIGTTNGLQRYDGVRFLSFRYQKNNPKAIPGNYIQQMLIDKNGNLWLLVDGMKVGIFDTKWLTFREVKITPEKESYLTGLKRLVDDDQGNVMLIIGGLQLLTYNAKANEFSGKYNFLQFPNERGIVDVFQFPGTSKYLLGMHQGMAIFNTKTKQLNYSGHNPEKEILIEKYGVLPGSAGVHFMLDKRGRLWFDTWDGIPKIYCYDTKRNVEIMRARDFYRDVNGYHEVHKFFQKSDGSVWVIGLNVFGEYKENENDFQLVYSGFENEQSISYNRVNHIDEDKEGNLWISTNNNGIYCFNPAEQFFTNVRQTNRISKKPGDGSVMSFARLRNGNILVGTWGDGLVRYDNNFNVLPLNIRGPFFNEQGTPSVWGMFPSRDSNTIWMAVQPGVYKYDQTTGIATAYNPEQFKNRTVRQIAEDKFGNLWIGTQSTGLYKWDAVKGKMNFDEGIQRITAIPEVQILKIYRDIRGYIWVSTSGWGLYQIDPATDKVLKHFGTKEPPERRLLADGVGDLMDYNDSIMIIASGGLLAYNVKTERIIKTIGTPETIAGVITALEKDQFGYVWASGTTGIYRVNIYNNIFIHFNRVDGIANDYFILAASMKLPDGRILFGADNQFVSFDPSKVQINNVSPDVKITGFRLMNRPLLVDSLTSAERINLAPDDNSIGIEFSGLSYNNAYIIKYKLEGLDKDWKVADKNYEAVYSYLPHGNYTFLVRSEDAEGNPGKTITSLKIKVNPPFWKTWWFLGLIVFAATAILFWLDKLRLQKLRATESIRTRIATSLTEDMTNSLSSINISSELAKTKIDSDTNRTKEYIGQISETSNRMVQAMYDMVWSIDPKNDTMADTIERMKSFATETENNYAISVDFDIDKQVERLKLDMEHRYELLCIFKEAVSNAGRHSNGRYVKVSLRYNNSRLVMMILDDGKGFPMNDASMLGRGMSDMRRRAAMINAILYIESEINTGTIVKLEMPV